MPPTRVGTTRYSSRTPSGSWGTCSWAATDVQGVEPARGRRIIVDGESRFHGPPVPASREGHCGSGRDGVERLHVLIQARDGLAPHLDHLVADVKGAEESGASGQDLE